MNADHTLSLSGKRAVVCGSSRGIGRACAELLAARGAAITLVARDAAALGAVCAGLARGGGQAHDVLAIDFADAAALRARVNDWVGGGRTADILVNNTGGPAAGPILDAQPDAFLRAFEQHVLCNQALVQALAPGMKARRWGRIINIISTSVREPIPNLGVSNTTRGAVASWAKTLARELAPFGVTVNNILPGFTRTERLGALFEANAQRAGVSRETIEAQAVASVPMGRFAAPEELAEAVAFLASPAAGYITGVSLPVDGGRLATI